MKPARWKTKNRGKLTSISSGVSTVEYIVLWFESQQHTLCSVQHPFSYLTSDGKLC